jgi:predicted DNA-binding ribbon-helix-helix protein
METRRSLSEAPVADQQDRRTLSSPVLKHSIALVGHKTSVSLEAQFWDGLHEIAHREGVTTTALI